VVFIRGIGDAPERSQQHVNRHRGHFAYGVASGLNSRNVTLSLDEKFGAQNKFSAVLDIHPIHGDFSSPCFTIVANYADIRNICDSAVVFELGTWPFIRCRFSQIKGRWVKPSSFLVHIFATEEKVA
jgi:hypothetical protein